MENTVINGKSSFRFVSSACQNTFFATGHRSCLNWSSANCFSTRLIGAWRMVCSWNPQIRHRWFITRLFRCFRRRFPGTRCFWPSDCSQFSIDWFTPFLKIGIFWILFLHSKRKDASRYQRVVDQNVPFFKIEQRWSIHGPFVQTVVGYPIL